MRNIHLAFFGVPHAAHMNAVLPILAVLARRGYRVTVVTSDSFAQRLESLAAEAVCAKRSADAPSEREGMFDDHPRISVLNMNGVCRMNVRLLAEMAELYENDRPDVIMYDLVNFAGRLLAHRWGIPAIQISPHIAFDESNLHLQIPSSDFRGWISMQGEKANRFFEQQGLHSNEFLFHREALNIYTIPKLFQPAGPATEDDRCFYAGRCPAEQPYYGNWKKTHTDGRPIALVSTSTTYVRDAGYFKACIKALSGLQWHVILSVGDNDPALLQPLPSHFEIVQHNAHVKILPYAGLYILQGGNMSVAEAAYHGVPMIATTFGFAELEWCADNSIVRLGLGVHLLGREISAELIRGAAVRIANDSIMSDRIRKTSQLVQREPGAEDVANRIDDYLSCG